MGSCFAQHISRHLSQSGCTYFVAETAPPDLTLQQATARNYGVFSARYGNLYTVRQAVQIIQRAFGEFEPLEKFWSLGERFVDPFRPTIEPEGFASPGKVEESRRAHFEAVRRTFLEADWLIFTLGLTEAWRDRRDGAVFPVAPGVSGGDYDPAKYEFVNFGIDEVRRDLKEFIHRVQTLQPGIQILLTVSPVPLVATYENRHVWASTVYSKSVLRVAAEEASRTNSRVIYFPSFEVITSPAAGGRNYQDDLRQVTEVGVKHVMRLFTKHFLRPHDKTASLLPCTHLQDKSVYPSPVDVVCDEETIEHAIKQGEK